MSPYAYAYRTCKHPCAYACAYAHACVVRENQALVKPQTKMTQVRPTQPLLFIIIIIFFFLVFFACLLFFIIIIFFSLPLILSLGFNPFQSRFIFGTGLRGP